MSNRTVPDGFAILSGLVLSSLRDHPKPWRALLGSSTSGKCSRAHRSLLVQEDSALYNKLKTIAETGSLNLSLVTAAALSGAFLPGLLPSEWAGQDKIRCALTSSPSSICRLAAPRQARQCIHASCGECAMLASMQHGSAVPQYNMPEEEANMGGQGSTQ